MEKMYRRILRIIWRVLTALLVLSLAWTTSFVLFPFFDQRMPLFPTVLIIYMILAYILLPFVIRFWHVMFRPDHIPRYVTTPDGWPADPVNIAVVAKNKRHFVQSMEAAGWRQADPANLSNTLREAYAIIFNTSYPTAPFSTFFLFGRPFDIGFQQPVPGKAIPRHRHHVRFWQLKEAPHIDTSNHFEYWLERLRQFFGRKRQVWIGAAIEDTKPVGLRWRNLQITHHNSHDHTKERDFIVKSLKDRGFVKSVHIIKDGEPFKMRSQNIGTTFIVDGNIKVVQLKSSLFSNVRKDTQ